MSMKKICKNCKLEKEHHAKGLCYSCYKKIFWKPKIDICKRCKRKKIIHAKGLCASCYNARFHQDKSRAYYQRKANEIDLKTYKKATKKCALCGFDKIVDIHHLDFNKKNNSPGNLIGLCPNHHRMAKSYNHREEVYEGLVKKGIISTTFLKSVPNLGPK
jgi:ribosomal protein L37E